MPSLFARPDTLTLHITAGGGHTLTVKRRLTALDARKMRAMQELVALSEVAVVMAYLVDWTFVDDAGRRVAIDSESSTALIQLLDSLDEDVFAEIYLVISAHLRAMQAEREQEKNAPAGEKSASAISPLPFVVAGASSGSVA